MIGIIGTKRRDGKTSFEALTQYCDRDKRAAYIGMQNIHFPESAAEEMASLAMENPRCKDPLMHIILSWREMEQPTEGQVDEAVQIALKELDLQGCQVVWIVHADTENRHVHIVANRIDPETHRAIQPAGRWTHKAIQKAARKIEIAQGWSLEPNGLYAVSESGEIVEKQDTDPTRTKLSKEAADAEAHTATKSAERIAQEVAAPIMRQAQNWRQLHERLAEQGIAFDKKGSGAILHIGTTIVKASTAGRDISLSKLCERLGAYEPRPESLAVADRQPEPVEKVEKSGVKPDWERYSEARSQYLKDKSDAHAELKEHHKKECAVLRDAQKNERQTAFAGSWKGRGALLNQKRSILAAEQKCEQLDLADRQKKELAVFRKQFPRRFMNFKTWLGDGEKEQTPILQFRYPDQGAILAAQNGDVSPQKTDLRLFKPQTGNKGGVAYVAEGSQEAGFIDYGRKIILAERSGDTEILAALQLANQKWGSADIQGSEAYKQKCVEIAAAHNLKIANPDLAAEVEKKQKERTQEGNMQKKDAVNDYTKAVGASRFRIVVTEITEEGTKAFLFDKKNGGYEGKTAEGLLEAIPKFSAFSHYGKNIIVTPMSPDKHHILVDDLTAENLKRLKDDGYSPACVIESSPGNHQAILTVPSVDGDAARDREAANRLTKLLNQEYGDPKLSGSVHGHRLPPFPNCKPKHRREDGSYPITTLTEADGGTCEKARVELEKLHAQLREARKQAEAQQRAAAAGNAGAAGDPNGAYWTHYRDIISKHTGGQPDYSRIDAMIGIRMRVTGYSQGEVQSAIEQNAPAMRRETMAANAYAEKYRNRDWGRYAAETTGNFVFGPRGAIQYGKAQQYLPLYLRLEGRNMTQQRQQQQETQQKNRGR